MTRLNHLPLLITSFIWSSAAVRPKPMTKMMTMMTKMIRTFTQVRAWQQPLCLPLVLFCFIGSLAEGRQCESSWSWSWSWWCWWLNVVIMMIIMTIMKAQMVTIPSPQMEHDSYGEDNRISTVDTPTAMSAALFLSPPKPQLPLVSTKVPQRERPEGVSWLFCKELKKPSRQLYWHSMTVN